MINIKNIILDLGGVLINLDYNKTNEALSKLGYANGFTKAKQINLFDKLEEGKVSELDFLNEFNNLALRGMRVTIAPCRKSLVRHGQGREG